MKIILRNFRAVIHRFRVAAGLNLVGLAIAFAAFLVVAMQLRYEYTFGKSHPEHDRIYAVTIIAGDGSMELPIVSKGLAHTLVGSSANIEKFALEESFSGSNVYIEVENNGEKNGYIEGINSVYPDYVDIFGFDVIYGDASAIRNPKTALLPFDVAQKFYGDASTAVGKTFKTDGVDVTVGGVYREFPGNSHIKNRIVGRLNPEEDINNWGRSNYRMFVLLKEGCGVEEAKAIETAYNKQPILNEKYGDFVKDTKIHLTPLDELYLTPYMGNTPFVAEAIDKGDVTTLYALLAIALSVIFIAAFNFVNFLISVAPVRIKSINTYKIMGSQNSALRGALVAESLLIAVAAWGLSLLMVWGIGQTSFHTIIQPGISLDAAGELIGLTFVVAVIVGIVSGIYPAIYTTRFTPVLVLKGSFAMSKSGKRLRMGLLFVQFTVSVALIITTIFIYLQNNYIHDENMKTNHSDLIYFRVGGELANPQNDALGAALKTNANLKEVGYSQFLVGGTNAYQGWGRDLDEQKNVMFDAVVVSWNLPKMLGTEIVEGTNFLEEDEQSPSRMYIFNEMTKRNFGISPDTRVNVEGNADGIKEKIRGISKDFHVKSLHSEIAPMAFVTGVEARYMKGYCYVQFTGDPVAAIEAIKKSASQIDSAYPLDIHFYDEAFDALYAKDRNVTRLVTLLSLLAIAISLVGVFSLVVFETQYRRKEIAVRKVNGASSRSIVEMINRKFIWVVASSFVVAIPITIVIVRKWLEGFAYKISMDAWVFLVGLLIVLVITVVTVTLQSLRSATENPIRYIRND